MVEVTTSYFEPSMADSLAARLSSAIFADAQSLARALAGSRALAGAAVQRISASPPERSGLRSHVPFLPEQSLIVDLRPGVLFAQPNAAHDFGDDDVPMGLSAARMLTLERSVRSAYDASSLITCRPWCRRATPRSWQLV